MQNEIVTDKTLNIKNYITNRVDDQIKWYDNRSIQAQKYYKLFQVIEIILAALIPLLAGYANQSYAIAIIIGIFGSIIAIIEAITKLFKFQENWI